LKSLFNVLSKLLVTAHSFSPSTFADFQMNFAYVLRSFCAIVSRLLGRLFTLTPDPILTIEYRLVWFTLFSSTGLLINNLLLQQGNHHSIGILSYLLFAFQLAIPHYLASQVNAQAMPRMDAEQRLFGLDAIEAIQSHWRDEHHDIPPVWVCSCGKQFSSGINFTKHARRDLRSCDKGHYRQDSDGFRGPYSNNTLLITDVTEPENIPLPEEVVNYSCACGREFDDTAEYKKHRARNAAACRATPPLVPLDGRCNHFLSTTHITPENRLVAYLGDVGHKRFIVEHFCALGNSVQTYFDNKHQAWFIVNHHPELVPPNNQPGFPPSIHTLGTIFEYNYELSPVFRRSYSDWIPGKLVDAPHLQSFLGLP
jgi:hypothetical protein